MCSWTFGFLEFECLFSIRQSVDRVMTLNRISLGKLSRDDRGQATIFMALCMSTVLLGFFALAADAGMLYRQKRLVQTAADAGALAAAAGQG